MGAQVEGDVSHVATAALPSGVSGTPHPLHQGHIKLDNLHEKCIFAAAFYIEKCHSATLKAIEKCKGHAVQED